MTLFSAYDPPAVPPMPLIHAPKWEWQIALNQKVLEAGLKHTAGWTAPVRDFAAAHGLPNYGNPIFGAQHSPHCVLAMFSALIGRPQPDWPAHTHQTGSVLYAASTGHLPPALTAFLAAGPQPILFTLGTSSAGAAGDFFQLCLEAANRLGRRALLLTGSAPLPGNLPDWALALPFVPYQAVFPQAAAIVHSGGIGSLMMGLQAGKPQLAITYAHDQHDNALRGARLGAVVTLKRNDLSANRLTRALRQLLEKDRYRQAAQQAQRQLAQEYPVKAACDCLEALLAQSGG